MPDTNGDIAVLDAAAKQNPSWNWYAIADSAHHRALPAALAHGGGKVRCLLGASQGSPLAEKAPHLVQIGKPEAGSAAWNWIRRNARAQPCVTVLASPLAFDPLFSQLHQFTEIILPDGDGMFFAFWDPAILGTLVGQPDDSLLHVPGPVLDDLQRAAMTGGLAGWWYWDRGGTMRSIAISADHRERAKTPLQLTQQQVDDLVEASVPDHVLYYLELNQPLLLEDIAPSARYGFVRESLMEARSMGLVAMDDLVNYVCAELIYKEQMQQNQAIRAIFARVKQGSLSFAQALEELP